MYCLAKNFGAHRAIDSQSKSVEERRTMFSSVAANVRSFAWRNLTIVTGNPREQEENAVRPRNVVYSVLERIFGRYIVLALQVFTILLLISGAIITTAVFGNISENDPYDMSTPMPTAPLNITLLTNSNSTTGGPQEETFDVVLPIFLSLLVFMMAATMVATRVCRHPSNTRNMASAASALRSNRRINQMLAQMLQVGAVGDAAALRSRLRLAMINRDFDGNDYELLQSLDEQNPHAGATEGEINRLPVHVLTQANIENGLSEHTKTCSICLAPYEVGDSIKTVICLVSYHLLRIIYLISLYCTMISLI